jgi:hypothetical protein
MSTRTSPQKWMLALVSLSSRPTFIYPGSSIQEELKKQMVETTKKTNVPDPKPTKAEPAKSKTGKNAAQKSKK